VIAIKLIVHPRAAIGLMWLIQTGRLAFP